MKPEHKKLTSIEKALLTWYKPDNPLYKDKEHPTIKLAGEIGELLDLYGKHKYKPNFDWMNCKHCKHPKNEHTDSSLANELISSLYPKHYACNRFTPIVLDELGDIWYYLRILAWQSDTIFLLPNDRYQYSNLDCIKPMYEYAARLLYADISEYEQGLQEIYYFLHILLANLDYTLEELTNLNYQKLNSDSTNHGWKDAR